MGGTCGVAREREGPQGASFYFVSSLGSLHLEGSVFICNILSMGCISSVLISRKIDPCFPGDAPMRPCVHASMRPCCCSSTFLILFCGTCFLHYLVMVVNNTQQQ